MSLYSSGRAETTIMKTVDFETGIVKSATADDVLQCVAPENGQSLYPVIELAVELKGVDCRERLKRVFQSNRASIGAKALAAVYLRELGDESGAPFIQQMQSRAKLAIEGAPRFKKHWSAMRIIGLTKTGFDRVVDEMYAFSCALDGPPRFLLGD